MINGLKKCISMRWRDPPWPEATTLTPPQQNFNSGQPSQKTTWVPLIIHADCEQECLLFLLNSSRHRLTIRIENVFNRAFSFHVSQHVPEFFSE